MNNNKTRMRLKIGTTTIGLVLGASAGSALAETAAAENPDGKTILGVEQQTLQTNDQTVLGVETDTLTANDQTVMGVDQSTLGTNDKTIIGETPSTGTQPADAMTDQMAKSADDMANDGMAAAEDQMNKAAGDAAAAQDEMAAGATQMSEETTGMAEAKDTMDANKAMVEPQMVDPQSEIGTAEEVAQSTGEVAAPATPAVQIAAPGSQEAAPAGEETAPATQTASTADTMAATKDKMAAATANMSQAAVNAWQHGKLETALLLNRQLNNFAIDSDVQDGVATISGKVGSKVDQELAEQVAMSIDGIDQVNNELVVDDINATRVGTPSKADGSDRSFAQRVDDATTTAVIKTKLLASSETKGLDINVDTLNKRVTLQGEVANGQESTLAEQIASSTDDVLSVDNRLIVGDSDGRTEEAE